jgi:hypothetical protein
MFHHAPPVTFVRTECSIGRLEKEPLLRSGFLLRQSNERRPTFHWRRPLFLPCQLPRHVRTRSRFDWLVNGRHWQNSVNAQHYMEYMSHKTSASLSNALIILMDQCITAGFRSRRKNCWHAPFDSSALLQSPRRDVRTHAECTFNIYYISIGLCMYTNVLNSEAKVFSGISLKQLIAELYRAIAGYSG